MNLYPTNIGDDGFTIRCDRTQWDAVVSVCQIVCAKYNVAILSSECGGDREGDFVRINFAESQGDYEVESIERDLRTGDITPKAPTEPTGRTFMVTTNWRGAMHVDPMRTFVVESEARDYAKTLTGGTPVLYELFTTKPPKKLKV